jgi:hypothetical protein
MLDLLPVMPGDLLADELITGAQHLTSGVVTEPCREVSGAFAIREEDCDRAFWEFLVHRSYPRPSVRESLLR